MNTLVRSIIRHTLLLRMCRLKPATEEIMLSEELVREFQIIVKEEYKNELSYEEATEIANGIVDYYRHLKEAYIACQKL